MVEHPPPAVNARYAVVEEYGCKVGVVVGAKAVERELAPGRWMVVERGEELGERKRFRWMVDENEEWTEGADDSAPVEEKVDGMKLEGR